MNVTVEPQTFTFVEFDASRIREITVAVAADLGLGESVDIVIEVDQRVPLGGKELRSLDPIHCYLESGALEHPQKLRRMSDEATREAVGRLLLEARDRLDPEFAAPALGDPIEVPTRVAWDVFIIGRLVRLGGRDQRQRRLYQFRNQHGFNDAADAVFDRLWRAEHLTFTEIESSSQALRRPAA